MLGHSREKDEICSHRPYVLVGAGGPYKDGGKYYEEKTNLGYRTRKFHGEEGGIYLCRVIEGFIFF